MKNNQLFKNILRVIIIFVLFEIVIQLLGTTVAGGLGYSLIKGKYGTSFISELTALLFVIILVFILKRDYLFKNKRMKFKDAIKVAMPMLVISFIVLVSNILTLGVELNTFNFISMVLYSLSIGLFEEIFFRGIILEELLDKYGKSRKQVIICILISSIIFGSIHLTNLLAGQDLLTTLMQFIQTLALGFMLGSTYYVTKNIWALVFLHGFYDFSVLLGEVNSIKDCAYTSDVSLVITLCSLVVSFLLSIIYLVYSKRLVSKKVINNILELEVTEEDIKKEEKDKRKCNIIIWIIVGIIFIFNALYSLVLGDELDKYYVCYEYAEISLDNIETHYYSYDDFTISNDNITLRVYLEDSRAYISNGMDVIDLGISDVTRVVVIDKEILILSDEVLYYSNYLNDVVISSNIEFLNDVKDNFITFDVPDIVSLGYLVDADTSKKYPMVRSDIYDLFVIKDNEIYLVS